MYFHCMSWSKFRQSLTRKKLSTSSDDSKLARVLSTLDLTALGIGSTLGVGVYVLAGQVSKNLAGPAVIISFLIAAIASVFAGLCYAEFGARVPKAGSAYIYSYVTIGEFMAFVIGWNLILEYVIGSASVVKGLFTYLDALIDNRMSNFFQDNMPMDVPSIAPYPDFFSLGVTLLFSLALALGARESSLVNNIFTMVNLSVVLFVIISGFWKVDPSNWSIPSDKVPEDAGQGGFAPYGISGVIRGAATCFYGFIGFDCIATAGEEAKTPQKSIPIAVVVSLLIIFLAYFGISTVLTMILPYYMQDENAPFPYVYDEIGWPVAKYIVTAGALCGLFSSLLGAMFPLPRIIYAMSSDGLMFEAIGRVHPRFHTPFLGTLLAGTFTGVLACIFELSQLFTMMSIGTLSAYSMVAACVLILRYKDISPDNIKTEDPPSTCKNVISQMFNRSLKNPNTISKSIVTWGAAFYCIFCFGIAVILSQFEDNVSSGEIWAITLVVLFAVLLFMTLLIISFQPTSSVKLSFSVPLVPWIPGISILINIYLMCMLDGDTWWRFGVWIVIGLVIYFGYGLWHSKEGRPKEINTNRLQNGSTTSKKREQNGSI
ncbi:hypothetical protein ILUMI_23576 [Ignelater luminosus]|uniref:Cationic amino acid transporter C-terminal domain-containing protein n=1 Tax=Ignelater luminosus TaxID=2038154 RepID=A0A8K0C8K2_IGNLU|nr:hypothetical protein ILUMI_23576 [Ignelater luminosus]